MIVGILHQEIGALLGSPVIWMLGFGYVLRDSDCAPCFGNPHHMEATAAVAAANSWCRPQLDTVDTKTKNA